MPAQPLHPFRLRFANQLCLCTFDAFRKGFSAAHDGGGKVRDGADEGGGEGGVGKGHRDKEGKKKALLPGTEADEAAQEARYGRPGEGGGEGRAAVGVDGSVVLTCKYKVL